MWWNTLLQSPTVVHACKHTYYLCSSFSYSFLPCFGIGGSGSLWCANQINHYAVQNWVPFASFAINQQANITRSTTLDNQDTVDPQQWYISLSPHQNPQQYQYSPTTTTIIINTQRKEKRIETSNWTDFIWEHLLQSRIPLKKARRHPFSQSLDNFQCHHLTTNPLHSVHHIFLLCMLRT